MLLDTNWEYVADRVMGGVSRGRMVAQDVAGRRAARLTGQVSLDNEGGFIQMAFDVLPGGGLLDASDFSAIELDAYGNGEIYDLRLRTDQLRRPWQSFRASFKAAPQWITHRIPFAAFQSHRTDATLDPGRLRRVGVLAIGREFAADVAVSAVRLVD